MRIALTNEATLASIEILLRVPEVRVIIVDHSYCSEKKSCRNWKPPAGVDLLVCQKD